MWEEGGRRRERWRGLGEDIVERKWKGGNSREGTRTIYLFLALLELGRDAIFLCVLSDSVDY